MQIKGDKQLKKKSFIFRQSIFPELSSLDWTTYLFQTVFKKQFQT